MTEPTYLSIGMSWSPDGSSVALDLSGELDLATAPLLEDKLAEAIDAQPTDVTLDFSSLSFLDGSGVEVLAEASDQARLRGVRMTGWGAGGSVRRVLVITGCDRLLAAEPGHPGQPGGLDPAVFGQPRVDERWRGFVNGEHVCWMYDDDRVLARAMVEYLREGLERREQLLYVTDRPISALAVDLEPLGGTRPLLDRGVLAIRPVDDIYVPDGYVDPARQVTAYEKLTAAALALGFRGLRVAADATALGTDARFRTQLTRYELALGASVARTPLTAMCAYDRRRLGAVSRTLACVHRGFRPGGTPPSFCLFHGRRGLTLEGEVDASQQDLFREALHAALVVAGTDMLIDLSQVAFIDVDGLIELGSLAERLVGNQRVLLVGAPPTVRRCWQTLRLDRPDQVELR